MKTEQTGLSKDVLRAVSPVAPPPKFQKGLHKIAWLPLSQLSVLWVQAQRAFDEKHAQKIADNFDPDLFGPIAVTLPNKRGIHHVIDGQHRVGAARIAFGSDSQQVPCIVLDVEDAVEAARLFDEMNTARKKVSALDKFNVRVTAEYDDHVAVVEIVESLGYRISNAPTAGCIRAVNALLTVYKSHGGDVLRQTLQIIKQTWGKDINAVAAPIIAGYGAFLAAHGAEIDKNSLVDRMAKQRGTPGRLIGAAKAWAEVKPGSLANAVRQMILDTYNTGRRTGKLVNGKDA